MLYLNNMRSFAYPNLLYWIKFTSINITIILPCFSVFNSLFIDRNSSNMRRNLVKTPKDKKPKSTDWIDFVNDFRPRAAIPVGPRFQADIPDCTDPPQNPNANDDASETNRWLSTKDWPIRDKFPETDETIIGKGRPNSCECFSSKLRVTEQCHKCHITEKRVQLESDFRDLFLTWKFDEMGEEVSKKWKSKDQDLFERLVRANPPISKDKGFIKPAMEKLRKSRKDKVSYYFNVYIPRRIRAGSRLGCMIDTDDEAGGLPDQEGSEKRDRANSVNLQSSKVGKSSYLTGHRWYCSPRTILMVSTPVEVSRLVSYHLLKILKSTST